MSKHKQSTPDPIKVTRDDVANSLKTVVRYLQQNAHSSTEAVNFEGTADRVARMYEQLSWTKTDVASAVAEVLATTFPVEPGQEPGMIVQGPIVLNSMCPHHLLPVRYHAYVGYLPSAESRVLGLSKLARIPEFLSKRFVLQEQLAKDIANSLFDPANMDLLKGHKFDFKTEGSIALLVGTHTCEACRGVRQDARTMVTERRGAFQDALFESRFMQAVEITRVERPFGG